MFYKSENRKSHAILLLHPSIISVPRGLKTKRKSSVLKPRFFVVETFIQYYFSQVLINFHNAFYSRWPVVNPCNRARAVLPLNDEHHITFS